MSDPAFRGRGPGGQRTRRPRPPRRPTTREQRTLLGRWLLVAAALAIVAIAAVLLVENGDPAAAPDETNGETVLPGATVVEVVEVLDGHTLDVRAGGSIFRVRMFGVVAPKRGERCEDEARERLEELAGTRVQLVPDQRLEDEHGRQLRYVYTMGGESIDGKLIIEGLAEAWRRDGAQRDRLVAYEQQARAQNTGCLWHDE